VAKDADRGARGTATNDDGSVVEGVGEDEIVGEHESRDGGGVGGVTHGVDDGFFTTDEGGEFLFEKRVEKSLAEFHGGRRGAGAKGLDGGINKGVAAAVGESKVIVGCEVDDVNMLVDTSEGVGFDAGCALSFAKLHFN